MIFDPDSYPSFLLRIWIDNLNLRRDRIKTIFNCISIFEICNQALRKLLFQGMPGIKNLLKRKTLQIMAFLLNYL